MSKIKTEGSFYVGAFDDIGETFEAEIDHF